MKRSAKSASLAERIRRMKTEETAKKSLPLTEETSGRIEENRTTPTGTTSTSPSDLSLKRRKTNEGTSQEPQYSEETLNTSSNIRSETSENVEGKDLFVWPHGSTREMIEVYEFRHRHRRDLWFQLYDTWNIVGSGKDRYGVGFHNPDSYNAFIVGNHASRGTPVPGFIRETHPFIRQLRDEAAKLKMAAGSLPVEFPIEDPAETHSSVPPPNDGTSMEVTEEQDPSIKMTEAADPLTVSSMKDREEEGNPEVITQHSSEVQTTPQEHFQLGDNRDLGGKLAITPNSSSMISSQSLLSNDTLLEAQIQGGIQCSEAQDLTQLNSATTPGRVHKGLEGSDFQKALCSIHFLRSVGTDVDALKVDMENLSKECRDTRDDSDRLSDEIQDLGLSVRELQRCQTTAPAVLDLHRDQMNLEIAAIHARLACLEGQKDSEKVSHSKSPSSSEFLLGQVHGYRLCVDDMIERGVFPWSLLDDPTFLHKVGDAESLKAKMPSGNNPPEWAGW